MRQCLLKSEHLAPCTEKHGRNTSSPQQTLEINNLYLDARLFGVIVLFPETSGKNRQD